MSWCVRGPLLSRRVAILSSRSFIITVRSSSGESSTKASSTASPPRSAWKSSAEQAPLDRAKLYARMRRDGNIDLSSVTTELPLYELTNRMFYRIAFWFCVGQFVFWTVCANWLYDFHQHRKRSSVKKDEKSSNVQLSLGEEMARLDRKVYNSIKKFVGDNSAYFQGSFVVIGNLVAASLLFMITRCVSFIRLMPGGQQVKIGMLTPFGGINPKRFVVHQLEDLTTKQHRLQRVNFIMLRSRTRRFPYIIDSDGRFENVQIYDHTVGLNRKLN